MLVLVLASPAVAEETMEERCEREIVELHAFFEEWFNATADAGRFSRFEQVISPDFAMVAPNGRTVERRVLVEGLRGARGKWAGDGPAGRVRVDNVRLRRIADGLAVLTYEERQEFAGESNARVSTVVMRELPGTPNGVEWVHLHETWLPDE